MCAEWVRGRCAEAGGGDGAQLRKHRLPVIHRCRVVDGRIHEVARLAVAARAVAMERVAAWAMAEAAKVRAGARVWGSGWKHTAVV